jgi:hypothetical protein
MDDERGPWSNDEGEMDLRASLIAFREAMIRQSGKPIRLRQPIEIIVHKQEKGWRAVDVRTRASTSGHDSPEAAIAAIERERENHDESH